MVVTDKSPHFDFYKQEVDRAIRDCGMWNDKVRLIVYTTIITETCDGRPFGWLNYTNPREPQFANFKPNDGDPPNKSWSTQRSGGLFQQQPQFWGPDVMDPYKTTRSFLVGFRFADGRTAAGLAKTDWVALPVHVACQIVQGSEFGDGSNYKRNIPYAQMVIDSDKKEFIPMADYKDPDDFLDRSTVSQGIVDWGKDPKEPIRQSLWGTNRAVNVGIPNMIAGARDLIVNTVRAANDNILGAIGGLVSKVGDEVLVNRRYAYWNQEGVQDKDKGLNNIVENLFATNGRVYHPTLGNKALADKLDLIVQLIQVMQPNNVEIPKLIEEYNKTHVGVVPVVTKEN